MAVTASLVDVALRVWPHVHMPNEFIAALRGLGTAEWPLVEQLAGDIYMGTMTDKFAEAAREASAVLRGTLYAQHYRLDTDLLSGLRFGGKLATRCADRAGDG